MFLDAGKNFIALDNCFLENLLSAMFFIVIPLISQQFKIISAYILRLCRIFGYFLDKLLRIQVLST